MNPLQSLHSQTSIVFRDTAAPSASCISGTANGADFRAGGTTRVSNPPMSPSSPIKRALYLAGLVRGLSAILLLDAAVAPQLPVVYWSVEESIVEESAGRAVFTVNLSHPLGGPATVSWYLGSGTAVPGRDFLPPFAGTIALGPAQTSTNIEITLIDDFVPGEVPATITLGLENPIGAVIAGDRFATVTIIDNEVVVTNPPPALSLSKTVSVTNATEGEPIYFTIVLGNTSSSVASNVTLRDWLPPGLDFIGAVQGLPPVQVAENTLSWEFPLLSAGEHQELVILTVPTAHGSWSNRAEAQVLGFAPVDVSCLFQVQSTNSPLTNVFELQLTKSASAVETAVGNQVTFLLSLANSGAWPVPKAVVQDLLPASLQFLAATENGFPAMFDPITGHWTVESFIPGEIRTLVLDTFVLLPGWLTNSAVLISPTNTGPNTVPNAVAFLNALAPAKADLAVVKFGDPNLVGIDQSLTNIIRIGNHGPDDSKDIVVKDTLPKGVTLRNFGVPNGTIFDEKTLEWKIPTLTTGTFLELWIATTAKTALATTNVVEITARSVPDPDKTNDQAEAPCQWIPYSACGTVRFCHPSNGDPHTNAIIELLQSGRRLHQVRSDAQGTFCFTNLPPGSYQIVAKPADSKTGIKDSEPETVEFGDGKFGGLVQVTSRWPVIRGRILYGRNGPPISGIEVKLTGKDSTGKAVDAKTTTDQDGWYLFGDLADGSYTVTPTPTKTGSFSPVRAQFPSFFCQQMANFNYGSDKGIVGRVITCDTPAVPVPYPTVMLTSADFPELRSLASGADGTFSFKGLTDGKYTVNATHPAYDFTSVDVTVRGGVSRASLQGTPKKGILYARIQDSKGAPVAGIAIAISPPGAPKPTATLTTDANGTVLFQNLAARVWAVQPQPANNKLAFTPISDLVGVGQPRVCRNSSVFTAASTAIELVALEVVQVVQDWRNTMPLVEGKRTLLRAFVKPAGSSAAPVTVRGLQLKVEPTSGKAVVLTGKDIVARADFANVRNRPDASLAFDLTPYAKGEVRLTLNWPNGFLSPSPAAVAAGAVTDNSTTVTFAPATPLKMKWVLLDWKHNARSDAAAAARIPEHAKRLTAVLPITGITADQATLAWRPDYDPSTADINENTFALYDLVAAKLIRDGGRNRVIYYTLVPGEIVRDNGINGGNMVLIRAKVDDKFYRNRPGHEVGHSLGRHHAVHSGYGIFIDPSGSQKLGACDEKASLEAPDFPMDYLQSTPLQPTLGPMRLGDYRFGYGWDSTDGTYIDPYRTPDLMSYCTFSTRWSWPGLYTYTNLYNALVNRFGRGGAPKPASIESESTSVLIRGYVNPLNNVATLDPAWQTLAPMPLLLPETGEFTLHLFTTNLTEMFSAPFGLDARIEADPESLLRTNAPFWFCLPLGDPIGALEVRRDGQTLVRRELSAHSPEVHLLAPAPGTIITDPEARLEWVASDADGDPLQFSVDVSSDGGMNWSTLAYNFLDTGLTVSTTTLPGSNPTLFRVTANDGLRQSSDQVMVRIEDHAPMIAVLSPTTEALITENGPAYFEAWVNDPEEGLLDGARVTWTSNRNGVLGIGAIPSIDPAGLSAGLHQIVVTATDSTGHQVTNQITVTVQHDIAPQLSALVHGDEIHLSWPASFDAWQVEATLDLGIPYWFDASGELEVSGDLVVLHVPLTDDSLFFRLTRP